MKAHKTGAPARQRAGVGNSFLCFRQRLVLTHGDRQGGYAVFACVTRKQVERLREADALPGWEVSVHPLIFSWTAARRLYQADFTLAAYRGVRLQDLMRDYLAGREYARLNAQLDGRTEPPEEGAP